MMRLIHSEIRSRRWSGIEYQERLGIACLAAVEAEKNWDPNRGQLSTAVVTYIRNALHNEISKTQVRMKYDGVQASCLLPSQIPAANVPDTERAVIFHDRLEKLQDDAKTVAAMLLKTTGIKTALQTAKDDLKAYGWSARRIQRACNEVRSTLH